MARPDQEAIDTFMSIAGVSQAVAIQKLEEHHGNLNVAVNAHFSEGDRNSRAQVASFTDPRDDFIDDDAMQVEPHRPPPSSDHPFAGNLNPISVLDPNFTRSIVDSRTNIASGSPFISHPRDVRENPIEVKDGAGASGHSGSAPIIEDVSKTAENYGSGIHATVIFDDGNDGISNAPMIQGDMTADRGSTVQSRSSTPAIVDLPDHSNDIEEEMVQAAIEVSKQDYAMSNQRYDHLDLRNPTPHPVPAQLEDAELAHAVSLSLQTAERENAVREEKVGVAELNAQRKIETSNGRQSQLELGSSSIQDESEDVEDLQPLRHRRRRVPSNSIDTPTKSGGAQVSSPSSLQQNDGVQHSQHDGNDFPPDEWGGITSEEHDEAIMLEAALFGGVPEESYATHRLGLDRFLDSHPRHTPRLPSPSLTAQRLIREQQDDEFLASLQADREKELKAKQEAEAALAQERQKEEEFRNQLQQEEEIERQIAVKETSLPKEPTLDDENAVTLVVRMPDGSRRGRRFLKSDKLQHLFDFIDVGRLRGIKPGSYRLVRPYPRHAFGDNELSSTLYDLGFISKQEALCLESI